MDCRNVAILHERIPESNRCGGFRRWPEPAGGSRAVWSVRHNPLRAPQALAEDTEYGKAFRNHRSHLQHGSDCRPPELAAPGSTPDHNVPQRKERHQPSTLTQKVVRWGWRDRLALLFFVVVYIVVGGAINEATGGVLEPRKVFPTCVCPVTHLSRHVFIIHACINKEYLSSWKQSEFINSFRGQYAERLGISKSSARKYNSRTFNIRRACSVGGGKREGDIRPIVESNMIDFGWPASAVSKYSRRLSILAAFDVPVLNNETNPQPWPVCGYRCPNRIARGVGGLSRRLRLLSGIVRIANQDNKPNNLQNELWFFREHALEFMKEGFFLTAGLTTLIVGWFLIRSEAGRHAGSWSCFWISLAGLFLLLVAQRFLSGFLDAIGR